MPVFIHDHSVTSHAGAWYAVKSKAIISTTGGPNWQCRTSGSGTGGVYSQAGDVITGAGVLATDRSWFVLKGKGLLDGGTVYFRELCVQVSAGGQVRIKVSPRAGFVQGTPAPDVTPSAADERYLLGGGTDGAPTFETLLPAAGAWLQARFSEGDDAIWIATYAVGGGLPTSLFFLEPTKAVYSSGGYLIDKDPAVYYARAGANCATYLDLASQVRGPLGALDLADLAGGELWARLPAAARFSLDDADAAQIAIPSGLATSPLYASPTYAQDTLRFERRAALAGVLKSKEAGNANTTGDKGEGLMLRYSGTRFASPAVLDNLDPSSGSVSPRAVLGMGDLLLPWELATAVAI